MGHKTSRPRGAFTAVSRNALLREARLLKSEHGENPEYDRALAELIYWTAGGESIEAVAREIGTVKEGHS